MGVIGNMYRNRGLLALKKTVCDELSRVEKTVTSLRLQRREIAPDVSVDDLLEIFCAEYDRLFQQLQAIDTSLLRMAEASELNLLEENRLIERSREALSKTDLRAEHSGQ